MSFFDYKFGAADEGVYTNTPSLRVTLDSVGIDMGSIFTSRTFTEEAADTARLSNPSRPIVCIVKQSDKGVWAVYENISYSATGGAHILLTSATLLASEGTLAVDDAVYVWALPPVVRNDFDMASAPGSGDDEDDGFHNGSLALVTSLSRMYWCYEATSGSAIWRYWTLT